MGGCRCTFRSCAVNTLSYPGMHFFHYPMKNEERLDEWLKYSNYTALRSMAKSQARNKVVCALHFRDECFMNYKKERLTPGAVPTLLRLSNGLVLDYAQSSDPTPSVLPPTTEKHLIPPKGYQQLGLADDYFTQRGMHIEMLEHEPTEEPPEKRIKTQLPTKILNKGIVSRIDLVEEKSDITTYERYEEEEVAYTLYEAVEPSENKTTAINEVDVLNLSNIEFLQVKGKEEDPGDNTVEEEEEVNLITRQIYDQTVEDFESEIHNLKRECDKKVLEAKERVTSLELQLIEAKEKVRLALESADGHRNLAREAQKQLEEFKAANTVLVNAAVAKIAAEANPKLSGTQLTKPQLFNGIKKYLSASMTALVRMEMFADTERQWKPDEKQVAVELLRLGEEIYNYFSEEWRFRLPPKKLVADWTNQVHQDEDEDDL